VKKIEDLRVKLFADGADKAGIVEMARLPYIAGFTTNPTLMRKAGVADYVAFATTPRMSTYLLAWVVGDLVCRGTKSDGVPLRVCSTPDRASLTHFALDSAKWDLHFYNRYFGIRYPLAKLDLIAVPDFDSGAMENFGCIIFRAFLRFKTIIIFDIKVF